MWHCKHIKTHDERTDAKTTTIILQQQAHTSIYLPSIYWSLGLNEEPESRRDGFPTEMKNNHWQTYSTPLETHVNSATSRQHQTCVTILSLSLSHSNEPVCFRHYNQNQTSKSSGSKPLSPSLSRSAERAEPVQDPGTDFLWKGNHQNFRTDTTCSLLKISQIRLQSSARR